MPLTSVIKRHLKPSPETERPAPRSGPERGCTSISTEYILLITALSAISALGTDILLPGLNLIRREYAVTDPTDVQYVLVTFFLGMAIGQVFVGPLSDQFGRKPIITLGYGLFLLGCLLSIAATDWATLLTARLLQGLGAAAPRVVSLAIVRDEHEGRELARILSVTMAIFILVPIVAPAMGQGLIYLGGWRATHVALALMALAVAVWFAIRQPETLPPAKRQPKGVGDVLTIIKEIARSTEAVGYTLATGFVTGAFVAYLSTAQGLFVEVFDVGDLFALYFGLSAASIGAAALLNARLVAAFELVSLTKGALATLSLTSLLFLGFASSFDGTPPLASFMAWLLTSFFCLGLIYGNLQALALGPLGHVAGSAAAFIGSISLFMSLPLAAFIGARFDGTVYHLVAGFALLGGLALLAVLLVKRSRGS